MKKLTVTIRTIINDCNYKLLNDSEKNYNKAIASYDVLIPGLEFMGINKHVLSNTSFVMGKKECEFFTNLKPMKRKEFIALLVKTKPSFILFCEQVEIPDEIKQIIEEKQIPVLLDYKAAIDVLLELSYYLKERLTNQRLVHATLVQVFGSGVLIKGASGIGKSEIALELIKRGHRLIADDAVVVYNHNQRVYGKPVEHLKNLLEVRGLGLIDVSRLFGVVAVMDQSRIDYIIELVNMDDVKAKQRLNDQIKYSELMGIKCPTVQLPVTAGRNAAEMVEVVVMDLRNRLLGYNTTKQFMKKYDSLTKGGK